MDGTVGGERAGRRRGWRRAVLAWPCLLAACIIQRPPVPPDFLDLRYEVRDSTAAAAEALIRGDSTAQQILRERLPDYARETHVDSLVLRIESDPAVAPVGLAVRRILDASIERASGRVRGAVPHPDAQRRLVEAVVLGLGMGLQRAENGP
jgi:hypothetical protein